MDLVLKAPSSGDVSEPELKALSLQEGSAPSSLFNWEREGH